MFWERIFDQHIDEHGLPENYKNYISKMRKALICYSQAYNGKRWQIVKARVYEAEANAMLTGESEKVSLTCAKISRFMGFPVKPATCTVSEFYNYISIMQSA